MSTIAAIATPQIPSAIGILRLSGEDSFAVLGKVFRPKSGKAIAVLPRRTMVYGDMLDADGNVMDTGLCCLFSAGHSYTGEDSAELYCHGSPVVLNEVLHALFAAGAVQARGGEFTKRAFLNGRMDLMQAEAVIDLIDAETAESARNAAGQLGGVLSRSIDNIYSSLMDIASRFYAVVDYPDEDIEDLTRETILHTLDSAEARLSELAASFSRGQLLKSGVPTVILGRPNAGKSSLLNALLGYDRAIVTDIPGTTRDTIEEKLTLGHLLLRLIDTAGIRATSDAVEGIGVDRARAAAEKASLAILVLDGSSPLTAEDEEAISLAETVPHLLVAVNKSDLPCSLSMETLQSRFYAVLAVSARTGEGISALCDAICAFYPAGKAPCGELLTNARQSEAVGRALVAVKSAGESLRAGITPDVVLTDVEAALTALGELSGKSIREDLVATIFSRFCVGK